MPRLVRSIRILWTFYRNYFLMSFLISSCCWVIFWNHGYNVFAAIFWFKLATLALALYFVNDYKKKEYYYYQNLGYSKVRLWTTTLLFDFTVFLLFVIELNKFR